MVNRFKNTFDAQKILSKDDKESRSTEQESFVCSDMDKNSQNPADVAHISNLGLSIGYTKHTAFLFDLTLAFLMMGTLSPKIGNSDKSFLTELENVQNTGKGEVQRYFDQALTLRNTVLSVY